LLLEDFVKEGATFESALDELDLAINVGCEKAPAVAAAAL